jgi:hypothetical protein
MARAMSATFKRLRPASRCAHGKLRLFWEAAENALLNPNHETSRLMRWEIVVFWLPKARSRWYSWLRSSPSMVTCASLARVPTRSPSFPKATHRCHSVRCSQALASFFQDVLGGERDDRDVSRVADILLG